MNRRKKFYNATLDNSNQDQKETDEDQDFLIFIRRVNDSLIFQWKGKTEAYLALKKRKKKGHSTTKMCLDIVLIIFERNISANASWK